MQATTMSRLIKRVAAVSAGVVLGMTLVAVGGSWRDRPKRIDVTPPPAPPVPGLPAPGTRV
jgi:hypothetical protein